MPAASANILVISDLHLGEDLTLAATPAISRHLQVMEKQLCEFLRHYARRRRNGVPWRLVINGDMVDFLAMCLLPAQGRVELPADQISTEEHVYGLERKREVACAKIRAVAERHRDVFVALAGFAACGNTIEIIVGNHDAEFHWPEVQEATRAAMAGVWATTPHASRLGAATPAQVRERVRFHPWFFYEPGVAWIEHGHQYDACSSFDYGLEPVGPNGSSIATNVDAASVRYISSQQDADVHALAEWSFLGYAKFAVSLGPRGLLRIARSYLAFMWSLLAAWRQQKPRSQANLQRRERHQMRLRALARQWNIDEQVLRRVDELRRPPCIDHLATLAGAAFLDRLLVAAVTLLGAIAVLVFLPWLWWLPSLVALWLGSRTVAQMLERRRVARPEISLALAPHRILSHIDAKVVSFGHTHEPVAFPLGDGRFYYNTGSWIPAGKPGALRAFTHVVISRDERGEAAAQLCQWRDGASRAFTPGWVPPRGRKRTATPVDGTPETAAPAEAA
jgi:UDP-2,3-diacylglucosamine pyrophosphatase LpxH